MWTKLLESLLLARYLISVTATLTFLSFCCSFNSTTYLIEVQTNTNLFMNINNSTAPFLSIIWQQKEPLGCVVYSHCPTNDSYNKCIHSCCLPCNYVTKPFSILKRVIKSQRVCISFGHRKSWHLLPLKSLAKFSDLMKR